MISDGAARAASPARSAWRRRGCAACARAGAGHARLRGRTRARVRCACGGPDKVRLAARGRRAALPVLRDALPGARGRRATWTWCRAARVGEVTQYADHEFHERLRRDGRAAACCPRASRPT